MNQILIGSILLSLLHAVIPSHRLPVISVGKNENWTLKEISQVTFLSGVAHALSTILIGIILGLLGLTLSNNIQHFTNFIAPAVLIVLGCFLFTSTTGTNIFTCIRFQNHHCQKLKSYWLWCTS